MRTLSIGFLLLFLLPIKTLAVTVLGGVTFYDDPSDLLNMNGLISVGDIASATFEINGGPDQESNIETGWAQYGFFNSQASADFFINSQPIATLSPANDLFVSIFDNFFLQPVASDGYTIDRTYQGDTIIWTVYFRDSTAMAHANTDFFPISDWQAYDEITIHASKWNGSIGTGELLLTAEVQVIPIPATAWLFLSAIGGLIGLKRAARSW